MPIVDAVMPYVVPFALVLARLSGLFIFTPGVSGPLIPVPIKALIVIAMTLAVFPAIGAAPVGDVTLVTLAPMMLGELIIGSAIGLIIAIPIMSVQMAGLIVGQQMGLGLGVVFNPALDSDGDIVGQILFFLALAVFLTLGGLEIAHAAVLHTFDRVPLGAFAMGRAPLDLLVGVVGSGMGLAFRVAAPVLVILMLETLATGVLMKTVPQLNVLTFGFPIKIVAATVVLIGALPFIDQAFREELLGAVGAVLNWADTL